MSPGRSPLKLTYRWAKRIVVAVVGFTVLAAGLAMTVLPGPAFVVIPIGLGILGLEFAWARRWLRAIKARAMQLTSMMTSKEGEVKDATPAGRDSAAPQRASSADSSRARNSS